MLDDTSERGSSRERPHHRQRHQDRVDWNSVAEKVTLADALALEAVRSVERQRRLVPGEDVELELAHADRGGPGGGLIEKCPPHAESPVGGCDHEAEVGDVAARRMNIAREREAPDERTAILDHEDSRVGVTSHSSQVATFIGNAPRSFRRQEPRAVLAADLARKLNERLRVARLCRPDHDHETTTP